MGDLKFILGFVAGWIATTQEGKEFANKLADTAVKTVKPLLDKKEDTTAE